MISREELDKLWEKDELTKEDRKWLRMNWEMYVGKSLGDIVEVLKDLTNVVGKLEDKINKIQEMVKENV
jgi:hypothetical protein